MNRFLILAASTAALAIGQTPASEAATPEIFAVEATPIEAYHPLSPFQSRRHLARHRFQAAMEGLKESKDVPRAIREHLQAAALDPTYLEPIFNLGILCQLSGQWDDAAGFLEAVTKGGDTELAARARNELERVRVIAALEKTDEGKRRRRYDPVLYAAVKIEPSSPAQASLDRYGELIKADPNRWEAFSRIGLLAGNAGRHADAARFLGSAASLASGPQQSALASMRDAALRETEYGSVNNSARQALQKKNLPGAAADFLRAWELYPDRRETGFQGVDALLVADKVEDAVSALHRIATTEDPQTGRAKRMLTELAAIEPKAAAAPAGTAPGGGSSWESVAKLAPETVTPGMELLTRSTGRLTADSATVLTADDADPLVASPAPRPAPSVSAALAPPVDPARPLASWTLAQTAPVTSASKIELQKAEKAPATKRRFALQVASGPPGAAMFVDAEEIPSCQTPCILLIAPGKHRLRLKLDRYETLENEVAVAKAGEVTLVLKPARGVVWLESEAPNVPVLINKRPTAVLTGGKISLPIGVYEFSAVDNGKLVSQVLMVRPDRVQRVRFSAADPRTAN